MLEIDDPAPPIAYAAPMPDPILPSAFHYLLAQRRDTAGFAAHDWLLELRCGAGGCQTGPGHGEGSVRAIHRGESNDPAPDFFWALFPVSAGLFVHTLLRASGSLPHLAFLVLPAGRLLYRHRQWRHVIAEVLPRLGRAWEERERRRLVLRPAARPARRLRCAPRRPATTAGRTCRAASRR